MRLIYPPQDPAERGAGDLDDPESLAAAYAYPESADGVWLRAMMVSSIDGAAQGPDGRSGTLSTPPDQKTLALLRALADVVLVGAGTARAEHYGPVEPHTDYARLRERAGQPPAAPMAVVSRRLELHPSSPLFTHAQEMTGSKQRTIIFTVESA
ncbi:dihydrofolate reductase family protein, partial [Phytoactinopolyspora endophytica]|uniref:dihydrofolate reductase family protein n=1 Tax=Phytoactinopolyspora endophytica TaxID=1642495 RepID=UPI00197C9639